MMLVYACVHLVHTLASRLPSFRMDDAEGRRERVTTGSAGLQHLFYEFYVTVIDAFNRKHVVECV